MSTESTDKKNLFFILKTLATNKMERESILGCLGIAESTFYKHINLIQEAGFKIKRDKNIYELIKYKNLFNFAQQELNTFVYLLLFTYSMLPSKKIKHFSNAIEKMLSISSKQEALEVEQKYEAHRISAVAECYSEKIAQLNKYLNTKKKITIILKNTKELKISPIEFSWTKDKLYLKYVDEENTINTTPLDDIVKIEKTKKIFKLRNSQEVIFELYGKLSKSYLLKEEERIVHSSKDKIVIASYAKDKAKLYRRLLRYDILCKVTFPKREANEFKKMLEKALANLSKVSDNI